MAYIQLEASVRTHRKFMAAGPAASWLWVCGMGYCQDGLTDGFIPFQAIDFLGIKGTTARKLKCVLVTVGLWEETTGGWQVHDYLSHNRSAVQINTTKDRRKAGGSLGGRPIKEPPSETLEVSTKVNLTENPSHLISATATDQRQLPPPRPLAPIHDTSHKKHAHCGRVCLPAGLFNEFVRRRNHADADREIRDWALAVEIEWSEGLKATLEPGDSFEFWKARYAEKWPAAPKTERAGSSVPDAEATRKRFLA